MLRTGTLLLPSKGLDFTITECSVPGPYQVKWKVLNRGPEAGRRNKIRGQISGSNRPSENHHEQTQFRGGHHVGCYIVKEGIVVARDLVEVPISNANGA